MHSGDKDSMGMARIYVGNLSYRTDEGALRDTFGEFGNVTDVHIVTDRETGRSRGFAFVEMPDDGEANTAIEQMNGKELEGRTLTVNEARPRENRGGGGGGGGGGRRW
jgi:RNA recognition motif-containing protein